jgi:predicted DNA binding CopG/RHH family protein
MPAVSFYLKKEVLDAVRTRASSQNIPVSRIISRAVEEYLRTDDKVNARKRILEHIRQAVSAAGWKTLHRERTAADADRD